MPRYYDMEQLKKMIEAKADTLIEGKEAFLYVAKWLELLPAADVVPRDEVERIENEIFDNVKKIAQNAIDLFEKHAERAKSAYAASACHSNAVGAEVVLTEIAKYERRFKKKCRKGGEQK